MDIFWRKNIEEENEKMRLFIAIDLPKNIRNDLFKTQKSINGKLAKINWVAKKNLHITLKFLGDMDEDKLGTIKNRLKKIKFDSFKLKLKDIGFFWYRGNPRVIRLNFVNGKKIIELQREIDERLLNMFSGDQKFSPHLTLGRVKSIKKEKELLDEIKKLKFSDGEFEVNEFHLVQSKLTKDGPTYKTIEVFKS